MLVAKSELLGVDLVESEARDPVIDFHLFLLSLRGCVSIGLMGSAESIGFP